jgi:hypothetical protein
MLRLERDLVVRAPESCNRTASRNMLADQLLEMLRELAQE